MAGDTGRAVQVVVIVNVAVGAGARRDSVQAGKREPGGVMIKGGAKPCAGAMALVASLWEVRGDVIRIGRALIVLEMAGHTLCTVQGVVIVNVAIGAGARRDCVQAGERESGAVVVERSVHPVRGVVTLVASLREVRSHVIGIRRPLIVL